MDTQPILLLGAGRLGQALAYSLSQATHHPITLWNHRPLRLHAPLPDTIQLRHDSLKERFSSEPPPHLVLLTVADDVIADVAAQVAPFLSKQTILAHTSGVTSLAPLHATSHPQECCGILHPLQAIAVGTRQSHLFEGCWIGMDGGAFQTLTGLVEQLGGQPFSLQGVDRSLYHAAAVISANYLVTLASIAETLSEAAGVSQPHLAPFLPLMKSALEQLQQQGTIRSLTGPIARGDAGVLERHYQAIAQLSPETATLYASLAQATLPLARAQFPDNTERLASLEEWLKQK